MAESSTIGDVPSSATTEDNKAVTETALDKSQVSSEVTIPPQELDNASNNTTANGHSASADTPAATEDTLKEKESATVVQPDIRDQSVDKVMTESTESSAAKSTVSKSTTSKAAGTSKLGGVTSTLRKVRYLNMLVILYQLVFLSL
jgi:hypothetical protein